MKTKCLDRDGLGQFLLCRAVYDNDVDTVRAMAPHASLDVENADGETPLCLAALSNNREIAEILIRAGANPWYRCSKWVEKECFSPMKCLAAYGHADLIATALQWHEYDEVLEAGETPLLILAVTNAKADVCKALLGGGAPHSDPLTSSASYKRADGSEICSDYVARAMNYAVNEDTACMQALFDAGASVNVADSLGYTPIVKTVQLGMPKACKWLIEHGALPEGPTVPDGQTLLMVAATFNKPNVTEVLLEAGHDPNAVSADGQTALHIAALFGSVDCARMLLKHRAWIDTGTPTGHTALTLAAIGKDHVMVAMLLESGAMDRYPGRTTRAMSAVLPGCTQEVKQAYLDYLAARPIQIKLKHWMRQLFR